MTYTKSGSFAWAGGGKSGAIVDLWAVSRFAGVPPVQDSAPPSGSPDAGPVTTGSNFGSPGAFTITGITIEQDYYIRVQYGGISYWGESPASSLGGLPVGLASSAGTLNGNYTTTGSFATFLTTASLGVGTWLVIFTGDVNIAGGSSVGIFVLAGTATASFAGPTNTNVTNNTGSLIDIPSSFPSIVTVTAAGTLVFQAEDNGTHSTILGGSARTGYTAIQIA